MPSPAPALLALRDQIDAAWPKRSKASDGILGDAAHAARASDHNQGDALDVTYDPDSGPDLEALAEALLADERVHYVIWNQRIRNRAYDEGAWRPYDGANPHTKHLHVSVHPERREDASPWQLEVGAPADGPTQSVGLGAFVAVAVTLAVVGTLACAASPPTPLPFAS